MNDNNKPFPQEAVDSLPDGYVMFWGSNEHENCDDKAAYSTISWLESYKKWGDTWLCGGESRYVYARPAHMMKNAGEPATETIFPEEDAERQDYPIGTFCIEFFPHALAELSKFSIKNQQKHNPDGPLGWARDKSIWNVNRIFRHCFDGWRAYLFGDREKAREEFLSLAWRGLEGLERFLTKMEPFNKD